jgi:type III pantothenate kinase
VQGVVDIGNTAIKIAFFDEREFIKSFVVEDLMAIDASLLANCASLYVGSTASKEKTKEVTRLFRAKTIVTSYNENILGVNYSRYSFGTLGADRVANAEQALARSENNAVLVIDLGTCITYDAINVDGQFLSLGISPGLNMRLKAMNSFTGRLPNLDLGVSDSFDLEREMCDTNSSMKQSVILGAIAEINDRINNFAKQFSNGKVVLTGGDAERLIKHIKISTFADPYWTLKGYNEILLRHL